MNGTYRRRAARDYGTDPMEHLGLVWRTVDSFFPSYLYTEDQRDDAFHEGVVGLVVGLRRYEPDHRTGARPGTFAIHYVKNAVRAYKQSLSYWRKPARVWDAERIAGEVGPAAAPWTPVTRDAVAAVPTKRVGFDHPAAMHAASPGPSPEDAAIARDERRRVERLLAAPGLDDRDREILRLRFGLDGVALTLVEIGNRLRLSRERVRQIERESLDYLRRYAAWYRGPKRRMFGLYGDRR